jgi:hypothetical protein
MEKLRTQWMDCFFWDKGSTFSTLGEGVKT